MLGLSFNYLVPHFSSTVWGWSTSLQLAVFMAGLSLIGFFLGMPLPLALSKLAKSPQVLGWCWTMHGVGTVLGGLLGVCVSLYFGFQVAVTIALVTYAGVGLLARSLGWFRDTDKG